MAILTATNLTTTSFLAAVGGAINNGDQIILAAGNVTYTGATLDQSAKDVASMRMTRGCQSSIGTGDSDALQIDAAEIVLEGAARNQKAYLKAGAGPSVDLLEVAWGDPTCIAYWCDSDSPDRVVVKGGQFIVIATADANSITVLGGVAELTAGAATTTSLTVLGGSGRVSRTCTTIDCGGGSGTASVTVESETLTHTTVYVRSNGYLRWPGGTITTLYTFPGSTFDASEMKTTGTVGTHHSHEGATIIKSKSGIPITVTNPTIKYGAGAPTLN